MKKSKLLLTLLMAGLMATATAGLAACGPTPDDGTGAGTGTEQGGGQQGGGQQGGGQQGGGQQGGGQQGDGQPCSHKDDNDDHKCDSCQETVSVCEDEDDDHYCDICDDKLSECEDEDDDHYCDICDDELSECEDGDADDYCDICGDYIGVDEEGPVITVAGNPTVIELGLGESLTVPTATALDAIDGVLDVDVFCETTRGAYDNKTGVFKTDILGEHILTYYACDNEDNETFHDVVINVTSDTYAETADVTGYNNLANLDGSEGTFKENFEKGWQSPLIKRASLPSVTVKAGAQAINGNSLVINYYELTALENRVFMNTLPIRDGIWTLSFDVKLIEGVADSDFYVGYVKEGEVDSKDQQFSLAGMQVGEVRRIEYKQLLNLDESGTYYFHFFEHMRDMQAILAFDNFEVQFEEAPNYNEVAPTLSQLQAGFTYDWDNNYMTITAGMPELVSKIENASAKSAIENAASGFGNSVMHLTGNGAHDLSGLMKEKDASLFQAGLKYTFEIDYYAVSLGQHYMIAYDGTSGNNTFKVNPFTTGLGKATIEYTVGANDKALTFYGDMDIYLGNVKITVEEAGEVREDYHNVTSSEIMAEGGYTFDWSANNILQFATPKATYVELATMKNTTLAANLAATNAFTNGYALQIKGSGANVITGLSNKLVGGNKYTISFDIYDVTGAGNLMILPFVGDTQNGAYTFNIAVSQYTGMYNFSLTFTAPEGITDLNFYINSQTDIEVYLANFTISGKVPGATVEHTTTGTKTWAQLNNFGKGTQVATPAGAVGQEGFADDYCLQIVGTGGEMVAELFQVGGLIPAGHDYKSITLTFTYYVAEDFTGSGLYIKVDGDFHAIAATPGYHTATYTTELPADYVCIYTSTGTSGNVYLGSMSYVLVTTTEA